MITAETAPAMASSSTGTSQLAAEAAEALTSQKTSPGTAKTLSSRAGSDVRGGLGPSGGGGAGSGNGGGSSIIGIGMVATQSNRSARCQKQAGLSSG